MLVCQDNRKGVPYDWNIIPIEKQSSFLTSQGLRHSLFTGVSRQRSNAFCSHLCLQTFKKEGCVNIQSASSVPGTPLIASQAQGEAPGLGFRHTPTLYPQRHICLCDVGHVVLMCSRPANNQRNRSYTRTRGGKDGKQNIKVLWQFSVRGAVEMQPYKNVCMCTSSRQIFIKQTGILCT